MKLSKLYIENFMCHEKSYIDFSQFSSALIIGKVDHNELYSNGVGKTTIFKAIEYVLFNQSDLNLEKIIKEETNSCLVGLDFFIEENEYRLVRKRTKKGITDVSLLQRKNVVGSEQEIYHDTDFNVLINEKFWKDLSGRRSSDTEKDLEKLIKINFKSFRGTVHFLQNDFTGLTTSTSEKRKSLFKDLLNLVIYSKLEKIAKEKSNSLLKDIEYHQIIIKELINSPQEIISLSQQLLVLENKLSIQETLINQKNELSTLETQELRLLTESHKKMESNYLNFLEKEQQLLIEKNKLEISLKDYQIKKSNTAHVAKSIISEVKSLQETAVKLNQHDFSQIEILTSKLEECKRQLSQYNFVIQDSIVKYEELQVPLPEKDICRHCRQNLTEEHRKICQSQILQEMQNCQNKIQLSKKEVSLLNQQIVVLQQQINVLTTSYSQVDKINNNLLIKNNELKDKKSLHIEYSQLIDRLASEMKSKEDELMLIKNQIKKSSLTQAELLQVSIDQKLEKIKQINSELFSFNKEFAHLQASQAVIIHTREQKNKDKIRYEDLQGKIQKLQEEHYIYPYVVEAFSSIGIPNVIIQNVLNSLQQKANELLNQLRPGLQLSFSLAKETNDGSEDTLDIIYYLNGKERNYEQLSGAMKLSATFSLKLGLSFLLQEIIGTNIKFLLLDEIDQSLDKAGIDAFAEIIKHFQSEYKILIITHNDRLKEKIPFAIIVEQDHKMTSRAKVVENY